MMADKPLIDQEYREFIKRFMLFTTGEYRQCPACERAIESVTMYQGIEAMSMYLHPCNHRMGSYNGIPEWMADAVPVEIVSVWDEE